MPFLTQALQKKAMIQSQVDIDAFLDENKVSDDAIIYEFQFDKKVFKDEYEVREWLNNNYYCVDDISETDTQFIAPMLGCGQLDMGTSFTAPLRRGVSMSAADIRTTESNDYMFSTKELILGTDFSLIKLNEGTPNVIEIARVVKGYHPNYGEINITKDDLKSFVANFEAKVTGIDLAINEDHKKNEAFGWFKDVFLSEDGNTLLGTVVWNAKGTKALSNKEYRYFSPELRFNYTHPLTDVEHGATLLGGALTNYPFLKMDAITALNEKEQQKQQKEKTMSKEKEEQTILLSEHTTKVVELSAKLEKRDAEVIELSAKITKLENEKAKAESEAKNKKLFDEGKINAAQLVALNDGKDMLEVLALGGKMNTSASGAGTDKYTGKVDLSEADKAAAKAFGLTDEEYALSNKL